MNGIDILEYLQKEIHTAVAATVDKDSRPATCAIDIMDADESGLYFLTAKGKSFYSRLKERGYIALTGIKGESTMTSVAISVRGNAKEIGRSMLPALFQKNPYMNEIYPSEESRKALTVFHLYRGSGEWFDLSKKPIERITFSFGGEEAMHDGYIITDRCTGCLSCIPACPQNCIDAAKTPAAINQNSCLHCGACLSACPRGAIERRRK